MKKINKVLFGFGSITAVVAPVAAVVACGDDNNDTRKTTITDAASFVALAKEKGYAVTPADAAKIVAKIGANAEVTSVLKGRLGDDFHGSDDYALVIKGPKAQEKAPIASAAAIPNSGYSLIESKSTASVITSGVTAVQDAAATSLNQRWGLTENNAKEATAIIYLQNDGKTFKAEYVEVQKTTDNKIVTVDGQNVNLIIAKA